MCWALCIVALAGCAMPHDSGSVDRGSGCAYAWPPGWDPQLTSDLLNDPALPTDYDTRAFTADAPALVWAATSTAPCATDVRATCSLELSGPTLVFHMAASWNEPDDPDTCVTREAPPSAIAYCKSPPLGARWYAVHFGTAMATFSVPGDATLDPCFHSP